MSEKTKNEKAKSRPTSMTTALLILGILVVIGAVAAGLIVIFRPSPSVTQSVTVDVTTNPITVEAEAAEGMPSATGCNYMWHNEDNATLTAELQSALDAAGIAYEEATVNAYGEQEICQSDDGSYYDGQFLIMDYSPQVTVIGAEGDAERGQQILDLLPVATSALTEQEKGYMNVVFIEPDGEVTEQSLWRVQFTELEAATAQSTTPEDIYILGT